MITVWVLEYGLSPTTTFGALHSREGPEGRVSMMFLRTDRGGATPPLPTRDMCGMDLMQDSHRNSRRRQNHAPGSSPGVFAIPPYLN